MPISFREQTAVPKTPSNERRAFAGALKLLLVPLFATAALLGCENTAIANKTTCPASAEQYWKEFRTAVLQNNIEAVAGLTKFPFVMSSGTLDTDRKNKSLQRAEFVKAYLRLLNSDPGLSLEPSTMFNVVAQNERLSASACADDGLRFRVGDWVFESTQKRWRFVQAYDDGDESTGAETR